MSEYQLHLKEKSGLFVVILEEWEGLGARLVYRDGLVGLRATHQWSPSLEQTCSQVESK